MKTDALGHISYSTVTSILLLPLILMLKLQMLVLLSCCRTTSVPDRTAVGQDARHRPVVKVLPESPQGEEALWALLDEVVGVNFLGLLRSERCHPEKADAGDLLHLLPVNVCPPSAVSF